MKYLGKTWAVSGETLYLTFAFNVLVNPKTFHKSPEVTVHIFSSLEPALLAPDQKVYLHVNIPSVIRYPFYGAFSLLV